MMSAGGGNNIGTEVAVRAPPDGYTLFMANTVNAINTTLYDNLGYNFGTDYGASIRSATFLQPTGFISTSGVVIPHAFSAEIGLRYSF